MSARFRVVLFDFDGTLADSYVAITASVNHVRAHHGLPPLLENQVRLLVGHGLQQHMADKVPGGDPAADAELYRQHHPSVMYKYTRLLPGVADALAEFHAAGLRMAVCSNKPVAITRSLLDHLGIARLFEAALGPEDSGKPKPDPAMVSIALAKLHAAGEDALYIGDMPVDIETARNAGVTVWVLPTGSSDEQTLRAAKPDRLFPGMNELARALLAGP